jgi:hypothetical protein
VNDELGLAAFDDPEPPVPTSHHRGEVHRRATQRQVRRAVLRTAVFALAVVTVVGLGVAVVNRTSSRPVVHALGPDATIAGSGGTAIPAVPAPYADGTSDGATAGSTQSPTNSGADFVPAEACGPTSATPTFTVGRYCGPVPQAGNGSGPGGTCTASRSDPPCGTGVQPTTWYAYSLALGCRHPIIFDGGRWSSITGWPPGVGVLHLWMELEPDGQLQGIGPSVDLTFVRATDRGPSCSRSIAGTGG